MSRPTYPAERLAALSDGVFAIVLTLLVLDLKVPELPPGYPERQMEHDLITLIPRLVAWLISFTLVARLWIVHHLIHAELSRCHVGTIVWNFVVLAFVSLIPFASALIGSYGWDPIAAALFSTVMAASGMSLGLWARHVRDEEQLHREGKRRIDLGFYWKYHAGVVPAVAVVAIVLAFIHEPTSLLLWIGEPLLLFLAFGVRSDKNLSQ